MAKLTGTEIYRENGHFWLPPQKFRRSESEMLEQLPEQRLRMSELEIDEQEPEQ